MAYPIGLLFTALMIRTIFSVAIVAAILWLVWKLGRLADAYTDKLRTTPKQK
jgi:hypothetical protein